MRVCNENSPEMEQCCNLEAKAAGVKPDMVEVLRTFNLAEEWVGNDPDRKAFLQKLSSTSDSSEDASNPLIDLLSFVAHEAYMCGYVDGYDMS